MEAAVAEREAGMTEWNEDRLDELNKRVDDGFTKVDRRFEQVESKMGQGVAEIKADLRELNGRFDSMQRTLLGMSALIGLIATQL
jgi:hypothetical protein